MRPIHQYNTVKTVPAHAIWVEADSRDRKDEDSCKYGPVHNMLVIGQVERIVWPPSRFGKVQKIRPAKGRAWWPF